jgi:membrane fusion protein (multidrug efflux system)
MRQFIIGFLALAFIYACSGPVTPPEESEKTIKSSIPATEVSVVKAEIKSFEYLISASGKLVSASEVRTQFRRQGIIEKILVSNGQNVVRGQVLGILSSETQKLSLSKAKVLLSEKQLAYSDQMVYGSAGDSVRHKKVSENVRILSGLAAAEIAYEEAKLEYDNSFIRAEIAGVVSGIETNVGSPVNQNDLLCFIHDPKNLLVVTEVLEADALQLEKGMLADVQPMTNAKETYSAKIENINPRVDEKTGLVKVVLKLSGNSRAFPGMHVQTIIRLPYSNSIIVPKEAVVIRSGKAVVFIAKDGLAKWNYVTVGRENGKDVEILEGLTGGDQVVITNNLQLAHDAAITVKQ